VVGSSEPPHPRAKAWIEHSASGDCGYALWFADYPGARGPHQFLTRVNLAEVVGLIVQVNAEKQREAWNGRLLAARQAHAHVTGRAVLSLLWHTLLLTSVFLFTFSWLGPISACVAAAWLAWVVHRQQAGRRDARFPPLLSWWCDGACWWASWRLVGLATSASRLPATLLIRAVYVACAVALLRFLHGGGEGGVSWPQHCLANWRRGGLLRVHDALMQLGSDRWWPRPLPPLVADFTEAELPELLAIRAALITAGFRDLLTSVWVGNYAAESVLSVALPARAYNSRNVRRSIHIVLDLLMPLFFCLQAIHLISGVVAALEIPRRLRNDPFVRLMAGLDEALQRSWERHRFFVLPARLRRFLAAAVQRLVNGVFGVENWMFEIAMPVDYFVTYVYARLHTVRTSLTPLAWALLPGWRLMKQMGDGVARPMAGIWLLLRERVFWGMPAFGGFGWWRRAVEAALVVLFQAVQPPPESSAATGTASEQLASSAASAQGGRAPAMIVEDSATTQAAVGVVLVEAPRSRTSTSNKRRPEQKQEDEETKDEGERRGGAAGDDEDAKKET